MLLKVIIDQNRITTDNRNLLTIEGVPHRLSNLFETEYRATIKPNWYNDPLKLEDGATYCKVSTTYYYSDELIEVFKLLLESENFYSKMTRKGNFPRITYWKMISDTQYNEVVRGLFKKVRLILNEKTD